jgi:hypothetical protein
MKTKIKTDNQSFKKFLNSICHDCLIEHARENLLPEVITHVILENQHLHKDSLETITHSEIEGPALLMKDLLKPLLEKAEDETIVELMIELFSKKLIITTLLDYSDEYARLDIIDNQNSWNKPNTQSINYN